MRIVRWFGSSWWLIFVAVAAGSLGLTFGVLMAQRSGGNGATPLGIESRTGPRGDLQGLSLPNTGLERLPGGPTARPGPPAGQITETTTGYPLTAIEGPILGADRAIPAEEIDIGDTADEEVTPQSTKAGVLEEVPSSGGANDVTAVEDNVQFKIRRASGEVIHGQGAK